MKKVITIRNGAKVKQLKGHRIRRIVGKPQGHEYALQRRSLQELRIKWMESAKRATA